MREEYRAIVDAGFILQLDDPGLPGAWDMLDPPPASRTIAAMRQQRIEILNHALEGIPDGSRALSHLLGQLAWSAHHRFSAARHRRGHAPGERPGVLIEAGNVRHEHEYKVWRDVKLPAGKILIPGVVSHSTDLVEHPELVADRIIAFAELVGRENVIAGTDCGLGGRVHPQIAWANCARCATARRSRVRSYGAESRGADPFRRRLRCRLELLPAPASFK